MKTSILEIAIAFLLSLIFYVVFVRFFIIQERKKYNYDLANWSATIHSGSLLIVFTLIFTAVIEPIFNSYNIMKMGIPNSMDLWLAFTPLLGQYLLLILIIYFLLKFITQYMYKLLLKKEGLRVSIEHNEKHIVTLYGILFVMMTWFVRYLITQFGLEMIPVSQSIF